MFSYVSKCALFVNLKLRSAALVSPAASMVLLLSDAVINNILLFVPRCITEVYKVCQRPVFEHRCYGLLDLGHYQMDAAARWVITIFTGSVNMFTQAFKRSKVTFQNPHNAGYGNLTRIHRESVPAPFADSALQEPSLA